MDNKDLLDYIYVFLTLYKKGLSKKSILNNQDVFMALCEDLMKLYKNNCDVNLRFMNGVKECFAINSSSFSEVFQVQLEEINMELLTELLFGQIKCSEFLYTNSKLINNQQIQEEFTQLAKNAAGSWKRFVERVGYKEDDLFVSDEAYLAREIIEEKNVIWCYNKSCTGKTYLGIYTLTYCNHIKYVYNPSVDNTCDINWIKLLLEYGVDYALIVDDLQCDVEFAKEILDYLSTHMSDIKQRNIHIFIISWSSLLQSKEFNTYGIDGTRFQGDMDFLIKYDDINQVNEIIKECGYIQGTYDDKAKEIIPVSRTEEIKWKMFMSNLFPYRKAVENKNVPVIKVDFRFKLTDTKDKEPVNEIVNNYIQKGYADNCYLLLHLCTHFYGESKQTISIYSAKDMNLIKLCDIREFVLQKCNQDDLKKTMIH